MQLSNNQTVTIHNTTDLALDGTACRVLGLATDYCGPYSTLYIVERCDEKLFPNGYSAIAIVASCLK